MTYVFIQTEPRLWTVGIYRPDGGFEPESDHSSSAEAAARVVYLNGGSAPSNDADALRSRVDELEQQVEKLWAVLAETRADVGP